MRGSSKWDDQTGQCNTFASVRALYIIIAVIAIHSNMQLSKREFIKTFSSVDGQEMPATKNVCKIVMENILLLQ